MAALDPSTVPGTIGVDIHIHQDTARAIVCIPRGMKVQFFPRKITEDDYYDNFSSLLFDGFIWMKTGKTLPNSSDGAVPRPFWWRWFEFQRMASDIGNSETDPIGVPKSMFAKEFKNIQSTDELSRLFSLSGLRLYDDLSSNQPDPESSRQIRKRKVQQQPTKYTFLEDSLGEELISFVSQHGIPAKYTFYGKLSSTSTATSTSSSDEVWWTIVPPSSNPTLIGFPDDYNGSNEPSFVEMTLHGGNSASAALCGPQYLLQDIKPRKYACLFAIGGLEKAKSMWIYEVPPGVKLNWTREDCQVSLGAVLRAAADFVRLEHFTEGEKLFKAGRAISRAFEFSIELFGAEMMRQVLETHARPAAEADQRLLPLVVADLYKSGAINADEVHALLNLPLVCSSASVRREFWALLGLGAPAPAVEAPQNAAQAVPQVDPAPQSLGSASLTTGKKTGRWRSIPKPLSAFHAQNPNRRKTVPQRAAASSDFAPEDSFGHDIQVQSVPTSSTSTSTSTTSSSMSLLGRASSSSSSDIFPQSLPQGMSGIEHPTATTQSDTICDLGIIGMGSEKQQGWVEPSHSIILSSEGDFNQQHGHKDSRKEKNARRRRTVGEMKSVYDDEEEEYDDDEEYAAWSARRRRQRLSLPQDAIISPGVPRVAAAALGGKPAAAPWLPRQQQQQQQQHQEQQQHHHQQHQQLHYQQNQQQHAQQQQQQQHHHQQLHQQQHQQQQQHQHHPHHHHQYQCQQHAFQPATIHSPPVRDSDAMDVDQVGGPDVEFLDEDDYF
eukprot:TRINITY_DN399_c0_g1_i1.p1 TRINITY_DN399_c0_g1~~TRINITY_DN399_c0_g1_i1.p1  ORF type:complete len:896 (-),score=175.75 TRINITY_DN399_c0_g1_i1:139-2469(-)